MRLKLISDIERYWESGNLRVTIIRERGGWRWHLYKDGKLGMSGGGRGTNLRSATAYASDAVKLVRANVTIAPNDDDTKDEPVEPTPLEADDFPKGDPRNP